MSAPAPARASLRDALEADADAVAGLHVASWRAHYRGSLSEAYLAGPIEDERRTVWRERLRRPVAGQVVVLAEQDGRPAGFVCAFADADPDYGTLIDNLHVAPDLKRAGLGRRLMQAAAQRLEGLAPQRPVHLFVLVANTGARAFYSAVGGREVEQLRKIHPDGTEVEAMRILWDAPAALRRGADAQGGGSHPA